MTTLRMSHRQFMVAMDCIESGGLAEVVAWTPEDPRHLLWVIEPTRESIEGMREGFRRMWAVEGHTRPIKYT